MVANTLHNIADHFGIEETDRQFHQLDEEVGDDRDVDAGADVEQNPRAYKLHRCLCKVERELGDKNDDNEIKVVVADTVIHNTLGEEGKDKLK